VIENRGSDTEEDLIKKITKEKQEVSSSVKPMVYKFYKKEG